MGGRAGGGLGSGMGGGVYRELSTDDFWSLAHSQNVTKAEEKALYYGKTRLIDSQESWEINKQLTEQKIGKTVPSKFMDAGSRKAIKTLDSVIDKNVTSKNLRVQRYVSEGWLTEGGRSLKQGSVITEHRFTSTSAVPRRTFFNQRKVHITIDIPKGKHAFVTKNLAESEVVLPRNSKFKVTRIKSSGGRTEVKLKVV